MSRLRSRPGAPLHGRARVPGDKSISHRALLLGAIAAGKSRVDGFLPAADCQATLEAVRSLGVRVEEHAPTSLTVHGVGLRGLQEPENVLDCRRSGTTIRLLAGLMAGQQFLSVLSGAAQLRRRPMARVVEPLRCMGARVLGRDDGRLPPLAIQGGNLSGIEYALPVASAQVKSAILLAALYARDATKLSVPGPARDHTERMLGAMGAALGTGEGTVQIEPGQSLEPVDITVPGDFSSAAYLLVAASLLPGSEIVIDGVGVNPTRTGLLDIMRAMGADLALGEERMVGGEPVAALEVRSADLSGVEVGGELVVRAIDEFPILAVAATQARGETVVRDAAELRVKETDRIATTVRELTRLGADIEARPDGFAVRGPTPLQGAVVHSHGDHRLAMALLVAGLLLRGETVVEDTGCIADSFPGFASTLASLGALVS